MLYTIKPLVWESGYQQLDANGVRMWLYRIDLEPDEPIAVHALWDYCRVVSYLARDLDDAKRWAEEEHRKSLLPYLQPVIPHVHDEYVMTPAEAAAFLPGATRPRPTVPGATLPGHDS